MRRRATRLAIVNQGGGGYVAADADARAYIAAVEAADGQPLENAVKRAIDDLFAGIKSDYSGLSAFDQLCLAAGPRSVAGCMVPLVGTAPTNVNFVSGDLNRRTGLLGDATTKSVNTNLANNVNPQNDHGMFAWVTQAQSFAAERTMIGSGVLGGGSAILIPSGGTNLTTYSQSGTADTTAGQDVTTGLKGISRSASGSYTVRSGGASTNYTRTSEAPHGNLIAVWARNAGAPTARSDARIAAWGVHSGINQAALESRLQTYLNDLDIAFNGPLDSDAHTYITAVESADGRPLETAVRRAINDLFIGLKADNGGSLSAFSQIVLLAGPRTLAGSMINLTGGTNPTNVNFVTGDRNRQTGWLGDGTTKQITTGFTGSALSQNNASMWIWVSTAGDTASTRHMIGTVTTTGGAALTTPASSTLRTRIHNGTFGDVASQGTTTGFKGVSRSASGSYTVRSGGAESTVTQASETPSTANITVFNVPAGFWNGRAAAYGFGSAIGLSAIESRLQTYLNALAAAGI